MKTVGSYEAKTHLPRLLNEVAKGEQIIITKHGVAIAMLISVESKTKLNPKAVIKRMKDFLRGRVLGEMSVREMIKEGRRF